MELLTCPRCLTHNNPDELEHRDGRCRNCAKWIYWTKKQLADRAKKKAALAAKLHAATKKPSKKKRPKPTLDQQLVTAERKLGQWREKVKSAVHHVSRWERTVARLKKRIDAQRVASRTTGPIVRAIDL